MSMRKTCLKKKYIFTKIKNLSELHLPNNILILLITEN